MKADSDVDNLSVAPEFTFYRKNAIVHSNNYTESDHQQTIRLRGSKRTFGSGRLEIYYNETWHVICERDISYEFGMAACAALGFQNGMINYASTSRWIKNETSPFLPYKFVCRGEEDLGHCEEKFDLAPCKDQDNAVTIFCRLNQELYCEKSAYAFGRYCYIAKWKNPLSAVPARAECGKSEGSLLYVEHLSEMNFVSELLFQIQETHGIKGPWLIGGYREQPSAPWYWKTMISLRPTFFQNWKPAGILTAILIYDFKTATSQKCLESSPNEEKLVQIESCQIFGHEDNPSSNCLSLSKNVTDRSFENQSYFYWDSVDCYKPHYFICKTYLDFELDCVTPDNHTEYKGRINITMGDKPCLKWNDPILSSIHNRSKVMLLDHNFCRRNGLSGLPWCYTKSLTKEVCDVPWCENDLGSWCRSDEIQCLTPHCIAKEFKCDSDFDCPKGSDELNCDQCGIPMVSRISARSVRAAGDEETVVLIDTDPTKHRHKVVSGSEATPGHYPWMVAIRKNNQSHCGGSIIDKYHILTAAHCFE